MELEAREGQRSALRGIGPSHQSAELPASRFEELLFDDVPKNNGLVVGFLQMLVFAVFFVLRDV